MTEDDLLSRLTQAREEHSDLDAAIARIAEKPPYDHFQLNRLKKRKLALKDEIAWLEDQVYPDIIA